MTPPAEISGQHETARQQSRAAWGAVARGWYAQREELWKASRPVSEWMVRRLDPQPGDTVLELNYLRSPLNRTSTTGQGSSQCLSVMVTTTVCPTMRYSPLTNSWEKRPDPSPPAKMAPFSLAALLALASSKEGATLVSTLKVLAILPRHILWGRRSEGKTTNLLGA